MYEQVVPHIQASKAQISLPSLNQVLFASCLTSAILPILLLWILFSTPNLRRQPVFWIQTTAISMSLAHGVLVIVYHNLENKYATSSQLMLQLWCGLHFFKWFTPIVTDTALIFRMMSFYPRQLYCWKTRMAIAALPVTAKTMRVGVVTALTVVDIHTYSKQLGGSVTIHPLSMVEFILQVMENTYISLSILRRIYLKFISKETSYTAIRSAYTRRASRLLLEAFILSFAPAALLQIALLTTMLIIYTTKGRLANTIDRIDLLLYLLTANVYVSLAFSLLATSWTTLSNTFAANCIEAEVRRRAYFKKATSQPDVMKKRLEP